MDKSIVVGLDADLPIGSWFIGCHCENDEIWNKVKEGTYHGFSIEAVVGVEEFEKQVEEINDNKGSNTMEVNENFWSKLKSVLVEAFGKDVKEESIEPTNVELEEEKPTEASVEEPKAEIQNGDPAVVEPKAEEPKEEPTEAKNEPKEEPKQDNHLEELINSLKDEIKALKEMNSGLEDKIKDLGKQPSAKPVNVQIVNKLYPASYY